MSGQLVIEPGRFAREGRQLRGTLAIDTLPRLAGSVLQGSGEVAYELDGFVTAKGHNALRLTVTATVGLACQRCLERLDQPVESRRDIVMVAGADQFAPPEDEAESEDIIPEPARLDVRELIEDELLLAMPLAPHHEEGMCSVPGSQDDDTRRSTESPFAVLGKLKKD